MKRFFLFVFAAAAMLAGSVASAQTVNCDSIETPYYEDFSGLGTQMPACWTYNSTYVTNNEGELFFKASSAGQAAVLPKLGNGLSKLQISFKTKCGTPAEGDGILIGVADNNGNVLEWLDTLIDANHSRNAWVYHSYHFLSYAGYGTRIALSRKWNTTDGSKWVAIDDIEVIELPDCYPPEHLTGHNLSDPDGTTFTWTCGGSVEKWYVYVDTLGADIDNVPTSLLDSTTTMSYTIPEGTLQGGGQYVMYVRSVCDTNLMSNWTSCPFGAGTVIMNNSSAADTVIGCGLVIYDNGGPVAGYLDNSNSKLVVKADGIGNQLEVYAAAFGFGSTGATLKIYDGIGTNGTTLYTYNTTSGRDTLHQVIATSTQGALTITFQSTGNMCHTGYELYVRCTGEPSCPRPSHVAVAFSSPTSATMTWESDAQNFEVRHRKLGNNNWSVHTTTTNSYTFNNLLLDTPYEAYVRAICGTGDESIPSVTMNFRTPATDVVDDCEPVSGVMVDQVTDNSARISWTSTGNRWTVDYNGNTLVTTMNPMILSGLEPSTPYTVRVRNMCSNGNSDWSNGMVFSTSAVGIDNVADMHMMGLYPNPASNTVRVELGNNAGTAVVSLIDASGRINGEWRAEGSELTIDVSNLAKGIYFVSVAGEEGVDVRKLIVK